MIDQIKRNRAAVTSLLFIVIFLLLQVARKQGDTTAPYQRDEGLIFGTIYHITYQHPESLKGEIEAELQRFNNSLSPFSKESVITKINNNTSTLADTWLETVFRASQEVYRITDGAFDPTISPLINAWGFGFSKQDSITPTLIDSILQFVGMERVSCEGGEIIKQDPRMTLNFSAIAKGYACDVIGDLLTEKGVENFLVEIGGEITAGGSNPKGDAWRVGINTPVEGSPALSNDIEEVVEIHNGGMATSGNYRNFYIKEGKRIAHTIEPKTGYPVQHSLLSATVIANNCMLADAYATAFMVLGVERSLEIAESLPQIEAFFIYADTDQTHTFAQTSGMHNYLAN